MHHTYLVGSILAITELLPSITKENQETSATAQGIRKKQPKNVRRLVSIASNHVHETEQHAVAASFAQNPFRCSSRIVYWNATHIAPFEIASRQNPKMCIQEEMPDPKNYVQYSMVLVHCAFSTEHFRYEQIQHHKNHPRSDEQILKMFKWTRL